MFSKILNTARKRKYRVAPTGSRAKPGNAGIYLNKFEVQLPMYPGITANEVITYN